MAITTLKNAGEKDKTVGALIGLGEKTISTGEIISRIGGFVLSDGVVKTVLNLSGTVFKPARFAARIFGITVLSPCVDVMTKNVYEGYKEAYEKIVEDYEIVIPESKEEAKNAGSEV